MYPPFNSERRPNTFKGELSAEDLERRTISLERRSFMAEIRFNERELLALKEDIFFDKFRRDEVRRLSTSFYTELDRRIVVNQPAVYRQKVSIPGVRYRRYWSWWQHFKDACFPAWMKRRWPPKFDDIYLQPLELPAVSVPEIKIDEPVYKACYVNLPDRGDNIRLFEVVKPEFNRGGGR